MNGPLNQRLSDDDLESLRQSPRQATVREVEDMVDELLHLRESQAPRTATGDEAHELLMQVAKHIHASSLELPAALAAQILRWQEGLSSKTAAQVQHGCHCDLENMPEGFVPDECVMDAGGSLDDNCVYARRLRREGKTKEACEYWKPIVFRKRPTETT